GYKYTLIPLEEVATPGKLGDFDILFLTCANAPDAWMNPDKKEVAPGYYTVTWREDAQAKVRDSLRKFVADGGSICASDLQFSTLRVAFPEYARKVPFQPGLEQDLTAEVVDAGLRDKIGSRLALKFDLAGWYPAGFDAPDMRVYLKGDYRDLEGKVENAPL